MKLLIFLQNGWGVKRGYVPTYTHLGFSKSVTGKRLREVIPDGIEYEIRNATLKISRRSDGSFPADPVYMLNEIIKLQPDVILCCGKVAREGINKLETLNMPILYMPHPAYRALTKINTAMVKQAIHSYRNYKVKRGNVN